MTAPRVRRGPRGGSTPTPPQDVSCVKKWARKNWAGFSDIYDLFGQDEALNDQHWDLSYSYADPQDDILNEQWIAYAIKVIYGGISTTCALYTAENTRGGKAKIVKASRPVKQDYYSNYIDIRNITYLELKFCACQVYCPGDFGGPPSDVTGTTANEAAGEGTEGLGDARPGAGVPRPARGDARIPGRARDSRPLHSAVHRRVRRSVLWP